MAALSSQWLDNTLQDLRPAGTRARFVVALSGGLDSSVLIHLLAQTGNDRVRAIHVDHGLQEDAARFAQAARDLCAHLDVDCNVVRVHVDTAGSVEANARRARYDALAAAIEPGEILLTAHHRDDQLETVLLQLMRGAGPAGLAAMPASARFAGGWHLRPFLELRRGDLADYAAANGVAYVEDTSNEARRFDRNYLRHEIVPLLEARWPSVAKSVARSAALAAVASRLLGDLASLDSADTGADSLDLGALGALSDERYANVVREWLRVHEIRVPNHARLVELVRQLRTAAADRQPVLSYGEVTLRAYRDRLHLDAGHVPPAAGWCGVLPLDGELVLPGGLGTLALASGQDGGLDAAACAQGLRVVFRSGGEKLRISGGSATTTVKSLMQSHGVLPWMRGSVPLLFAGEQLAAVGDVWQSHDLRARPRGPSCVIAWHGRPLLFASPPR